jgi:hypothetical protein
LFRLIEGPIVLKNELFTEIVVRMTLLPQYIGTITDSTLRCSDVNSPHLMLLRNIPSALIVYSSRSSGPLSIHQPSRILGFWRQIAILADKRYSRHRDLGPVQSVRTVGCVR